MFILPNGQNIQFLPPTLPEPRPVHHPPSTSSPTVPPWAERVLDPKAQQPETHVLQALKDIAPHLNRKQRRAKIAELKSKARSETAAAAKKEMEKQKKEAARG